MKKKPLNHIISILILARTLIPARTLILTLTLTLTMTLIPALTGCSLRQAVSSVQGANFLQPGQEQYETTFYDLFDTVSTIKGYADSEAEFTETATQMYNEMTTYHQLFDIYHDYEGVNNLKTINDNASKAPVEVDEKLMDLLLFGKEIYEESGGKVNIFMGSVLKIWHEAREAADQNPAGASLPEEALLKEAAKHTDPDQVIIDTKAKTVYLEDPLQRIDAGAIGKGYASQQVMKIIQQGDSQNFAETDQKNNSEKTTGIEQQKDADQQAIEADAMSYVLNLGGNICVSAPKPDGSDWSIGVQDPEDPEGYLKKLGISSGCVVTSGDYQRYFTVDGKRYHHIIDPDSLMPSDQWKSVTIIAEDSGMADFLSTALFLMDREEGTKLLKKHHAEACWIDQNGTVFESEGFGRYEK